MGATAQVPTVAALRPLVQPPYVRARPAEHWTADVYLRAVSPYLTRRFLLWGASADAVTWLMVGTGVLSGLALLLPGLTGALLAVGLGQLQMLLDCCDGEVARYRGTSSARGVFLDKLGHYGAETSLALALGARAALEDDLAWGMTAGALLALGIVANRAVNDMVHASRAVGGLPPLTAEVAHKPDRRGWGRAWSAARALPVHRVLHSVELTLLALVAALVSAVADVPATAWLVVVAVPVVALVLVGHVAAVLTSTRLR
ncbi:CDP-alcohol phosphatidyltransferase family protein [Cellulomonas sp. DKR-3]|uniref:CDP-alcohol phosphatidyltransferase family protein n=1 Tax=Cellulomonas fulva TaxID=2835530 RepID=A0ABS5TZQ5_9CELL|nr:CDP-alcohol phosphatidyltransferase family protein [Cellulomonas fulva]MBT0994606.1 CDP-alcohol phosphatidyltransferase family protein [Cellulomonas fulva]